MARPRGTIIMRAHTCATRLMRRRLKKKSLIQSFPLMFVYVLQWEEKKENKIVIWHLRFVQKFREANSYRLGTFDSEELPPTSCMHNIVDMCLVIGRLYERAQKKRKHFIQRYAHARQRHNIITAGATTTTRTFQRERKRHLRRVAHLSEMMIHQR